jgi:hypothetical protein
VTGKSEGVEWLWYPNAWTDVDDHHVYDAKGDIRRALEALPAGSSTWGATPGWSVSQPEYPNAKNPVLDVKAPGRAPMRVVLTADKKGAMVIAEDGSFELIGQVPAVLRASASCGAWPIEVCGAAQEEPGLTEAWFHDRSAPPSSSAPAGP